MKILLVDLDHGFITRSEHVPKCLGLAKYSTFLKKNGHEVFYGSCKVVPKIYPDVIAFSPIFKFKLNKDLAYIKAFAKKFPNAEIHIGGVQATYDDTKIIGELPRAKIFKGIQEFDSEKPDYKLIGKFFSFGFTSRGCVRQCPWCLVPRTEGKLHTIPYWTNSLENGHSLFLLMDNNILACGADWLEHIFIELKTRKMKIDFNQGLDIRIFVKSKEIQNLFFKYKHLYNFLRFSWDSSSVDSVVLESLEILKKLGKEVRWYMLYGFNDTPEQIFFRIKTLMETKGFTSLIKPMLYKDLDTGETPSFYGKAFNWYMAKVASASNFITPSSFKLGKFGHNEDEFKRVLKLGDNYRLLTKTIGGNVNVKNRNSVIKYIKKT